MPIKYTNIKKDNLTIKVYKGEGIEEYVKEKYLQHLYESYIIANLRLSTFFDKPYLDISKYPKLTVLFSSNLEHFKEMAKENDAGEWISKMVIKESFAFVSGTTMLRYVSEERLREYTPPNSKSIDGMSHEFTHCLFADYLDISKSKFNKYIPLVLEEGLATFLNGQYKYIYYLKKELEREFKFKDITLKEILKNGILLDPRLPEESYTYQYMAHIVYIISKKLNKPFGVFIKENINKDIDIFDVLKENNIDINTLDKDIRKGLGIS